MKTIIKKMKMKMVKKYETENESDLSIFLSFSRNIVFLRFSTVFYRLKYRIHIQCQYTLLSIFLECQIYIFRVMTHYPNPKSQPSDVNLWDYV